MHELYRRRLPHIMPPGETLFITYRLHGTIPVEVLLRLKEEHESFLAEQVEGNPDFLEKDLRKKWETRYFLSLDALIDRATEGSCWLADLLIARIVEESIHYRDAKQFDLHAYCVMPNHVHVLLTNTSQDTPFYRVLGSMKANSAKAINEHLNQIGQSVWASESYDHVVRNEKSFDRVIRYILNNPVKAGLVERWQDWPHSYCQQGKAGGNPLW